MAGNTFLFINRYASGILPAVYFWILCRCRNTLILLGSKQNCCDCEDFFVQEHAEKKCVTKSGDQ